MNNEKKCIIHYSASRRVLLFYSPKPCCQVWILIHLCLLNLRSFITFRPSTACSSSFPVAASVFAWLAVAGQNTQRPPARPKIYCESKQTHFSYSLNEAFHLPEFQAKLFSLRNWVLQIFPWFTRRVNEKCLTTTVQFQYYWTVLSLLDYPNEWYVNVDNDPAMVVLLHLKKAFTVYREPWDTFKKFMGFDWLRPAVSYFS